MFPVKHTVIYTFFAITSVQNTCFCSVFNALASKNPAKSCYVQCFFHFWPFFHCRKATKMTQNSISIPSCAQTPKNPRKMSKTPPYSGLGAKPFLGPPAKADIATAILTNVIEHLVLLLPPNKHAFTAKAVWADFKRFLRPHFIKGAQNVFLYRFMQFMKYNRGTMDLQKWMTRFQLTGNRLIESWMDLLPEATVTSPEAILFVAQKRQEHDRDQQERAEVAAASGAAPHVPVPWSDELALVAFKQYQEHRRQIQWQAFPLGENLLALTFVSLADLTQDQRNTLTSIMTHRGRTLDRYNIQELRDLFLEMFCTT